MASQIVEMGKAEGDNKISPLLVECPNCHRKSGGDYCAWCGHPLPASLYEGIEMGKDRVGNKNWFQRHLNWTWVLVTVLGSDLLGLLFGLIVVSLDPYGRYIPIESLYGWVYLIAIALAIIVGSWVLREKSRSLWWLLIFLIPFGWIAFLCLENKSSEKPGGY